MRNRITFYLAIKTLCFILMPSKLQAQTQGAVFIDSIENAIPKLKEDTFKLKVLNYYVGKLGNLGKTDLALKYGKEALTLAEKLNQPHHKADAYHYIGILHRNIGNYPEAFTYLHNALVIRENMKDSMGIARSFGTLGTIYASQKDYVKAEEYLLKSIAVLRVRNDLKGLSNSLGNLGAIYATQQKYSEAFALFKEVLEIDLKRGDKLNATGSYANLAAMLTEQHKYEDALSYHLKAFAHAAELKSPILMTSLHSNIGRTYFLLGQYDSSRVHLLKGLSSANEIKSITSLQDVYQHLASLDSATGNLAQALQYYKLYIQMKDSLFNESNTKKIMQTQMQYEFDKKDALAKVDFQRQQDSLRMANQKHTFALQKEMQLKSLRFEYAKKQELAKSAEERKQLMHEEELKRNQINFEFQQKQQAMESEQQRKDLLQTTAQQQKEAQYKLQQLQNEEKAKQQRNALLGAFGMLSMVGIFFFYNNRQKQRTKRKQEMELMKQRISHDLHDDIGSTLNSISLFAEVAKRRAEKNESIQDLVSDISNISKDMMSRMGDIVWSLKAGNETVEKLQERLYNYCSQSLTPLQIAYSFDINSELYPYVLNSEMIKEIYLIAKEAINNSMKYATCNHINISLYKFDDKLIMKIKDDGKGFNTLKTYQGLGGEGIKNMNSRAENIYAELEIKSDESLGTEIILSIPLINRLSSTKQLNL
ncbi:MAG TPA: tetratricopeptide repeat protein [Chitinophagaceae bacterium]|nr:tetratricopeptide repeat protein [Chitinophagaceae bacterium]